MFTQEESGRSEVELEEYLQQIERLENALLPPDQYIDQMRDSGQLPALQQETNSTSVPNDSGLKDFADSFGYASIILLLCVIWGWAVYLKNAGGLHASSDLKRKYRKLIVALTQISITMLILSGILQIPFL